MATTTVDAAPAGAEPFRWDRLTIASAVGYCILVAGLSVGNVLGELRAEFGISGVITALHGSTFGIGLLVMGLFGVSIVDRIGRRGALIGSVLLASTGIAMFCVGDTWQITLAGTMLSGLSGATYVMVMPGIIGDHHGVHLGRALAEVNAVPAVAGIAYGLVIGAVLSAGHSWRAPYLLLTAVIVVMASLVAFPVRVPDGLRHGDFTLRHLRRRSVLVPWLFIVNAALVEFTVGVWTVTYLREVGGASSGAAPLLAMIFGVCMFTSRLLLHQFERWLGAHIITASFLALGAGALCMIFIPSLAGKVFGLGLAGFASGPLYPLTVARFYRAVGGRIDSVGLGAYAAIANGLGVLTGPLALGVLADTVGLRWGLLIVPILTVVGAVTQRHRPVPVPVR